MSNVEVHDQHAQALADGLGSNWRGKRKEAARFGGEERAHEGNRHNEFAAFVSGIIVGFVSCCFICRRSSSMESKGEGSDGECRHWKYLAVNGVVCLRACVLVRTCASHFFHDCFQFQSLDPSLSLSFSAAVVRTGSSDRKGENDEDNDAVTFVGSASLACNAESKSIGQGLYLNTNLARKGVSQSPDGELAGLQRQTAPVTVNKHE